MKILGLKIGPLLAAAVAMYVVGALIYGALFSAQWEAWSGHTPESMADETWRMALSPIMPIVLAIGLGLLVKDRGISTWMPGLKLGALVGLVFLVATRMYTYVYGDEPLQLFILDGVHLLLIGAIGGAILGALKVAE